MRDFAEMFEAGLIVISRLQTSKKSHVLSCAVAWSLSLERNGFGNTFSCTFRYT